MGVADLSSDLVLTQWVQSLAFSFKLNNHPARQSCKKSFTISMALARTPRITLMGKS